MKPFELDARAAWNAGAEAFARFVDSGADYYRHLVHGPGLLAACGEVRGVAALDAGCGHGYFARLLARAGAAVTGVDLSDGLLARAVEAEAKEPWGIRYVHMEAAEIGDRFGEGRFDLVTGCMSLQDMADPAAVLAGAERVLRRKGRMVFSVPHPCTDPPVREWQRDGQGRKLALCLDRYFDAGPAVCHRDMKRLTGRWSTPYHRFTLTQWGTMIRGAGFVIRGLSEPRPDARAVALHPELEDCSRMPYFLVFEVVKAASGS
ncbi:MAG: class I SAM-dependent methyltransferase [Gemmataceae bacterium]